MAPDGPILWKMLIWVNGYLIHVNKETSDEMIPMKLIAKWSMNRWTDWQTNMHTSNSDQLYIYLNKTQLLLGKCSNLLIIRIEDWESQKETQNDRDAEKPRENGSNWFKDKIHISIKNLNISRLLSFIKIYHLHMILFITWPNLVLYFQKFIERSKPCFLVTFLLL